ncbi:ribonucleoprotein, chloroplastic [Glycine soja]
MRTEIGESRGGAYVTMESINSARKAIVALDASDVGGRQVQVRFFVEMNPKRRNLETMNSSPRSVGPQDLRQLFVSFGNVTSVRVLQDLRKRNCRVYAFVSYHSETKHDAAMSLNGIVKSAYAIFHCSASYMLTYHISMDMFCFLPKILQSV